MRNVGQLLTLNIDGLLRRAYDEVFSNSSPVLEFPGLMVNDSKSYFQRNYPVILNLHGVYTHRTTWVMSRQERERLFTGISKGDYRAFLRHIFETCNVVFVGVNIRDVAISPILEEINSSNLLQNHYWITSDITTENYQWCQKRGVRVITDIPQVACRLTSRSPDFARWASVFRPERCLSSRKRPKSGGSSLEPAAFWPGRAAFPRGRRTCPAAFVQLGHGSWSCA
ncbi:SIR2 family protein [Frigidibacter mobilis]|uniref:Uncharacterized protein n=1 Tax=Frigidibacter mobilis TaxID=1335048 RepID=A0A161GSD3_9RHOB|nr:hypothetical protein AKL17_3469 [Frigidibacter mobilis]